MTDPAKIRITIAGHPVGKGRARTVRTRDGRVMSFTPERTRRWEENARLQAQTCMAGRSPLTGPVALRVCAYLAVPSSWPAWKREAALHGHVRPTGKPDLDNILKAAKDAMNGVLWIDDAQVVLVVTDKVYSDTPRVEIQVDVLDAAPSQITRKGDVGAWLTGRVA